jgi:8-oxo-dGTP diphosphatase
MPALSSAGMAQPEEQGPAGPGEQVTVIVDGANVMGSRADGWWRDRAAAMARLYGELVRLAARGVPDLRPGEGTADRQPAAGDRLFPDFVLVAEGRSRSGVQGVSRAGRVRVVAAPGEGDEEIARLARDLPGRRIVITADQELRRRCLDGGAEVTGPRWLLGLLK